MKASLTRLMKRSCTDSLPPSTLNTHTEEKVTELQAHNAYLNVRSLVEYVHVN